MWGSCFICLTWIPIHPELPQHKCHRLIFPVDGDKSWHYIWRMRSFLVYPPNHQFPVNRDRKTTAFRSVPTLLDFGQLEFLPLKASWVFYFSGGSLARIHLQNLMHIPLWISLLPSWSFLNSKIGWGFSESSLNWSQWYFTTYQGFPFWFFVVPFVTIKHLFFAKGGLCRIHA